MDSEVQLVNLSPPLASQSGTQEGTTPSEGFSLPPVDSGKEAWLFLLGSFVFEAYVWGFAFAFGIFEDYYSQHEPFSSEQGGIASIGTTATGIMYLSTLFAMPLLHRWPRFRRPATLVGLLIMASALVLASFANTVWQLVLTQGVLYGVGGTILYSPTILFLDEWFVRRKGFAYGVMWAGTGVGGVVVPLIMNAGLEKYGFRTMLRAWALGITVTGVPLLWVVKPRLPIATTGHQKRVDLAFLASPAFCFMELCNIIQSLGFFLPGIYLPRTAQMLGVSSTGSALTLILLNLAGVFGSMVIGAMVDRVHVTTCMLITSLGGSLAVFLLWGFSESLPLLLIFSVCYGLTAGSFSTTYTGIIKEVQKVHAADTGITFGLLAMGRGIGALASGPLSESLLSTSSGLGHSPTLYGSSYSSLVIFTGVTAAVSASGFVWFRLGWW